MVELLTTREVQELLQVDRSTIYRMAETQRLPAIKVGKQWRFPADRVRNWLQQQTTVSATVWHPPQDMTGCNSDLESLLPADCVQLIQDTFAEALGVMMVTTDMQGHPLTEISHPCGLFKVISQTPNAIQKCIENWTELETTPGIAPQFIYSRLGLLGIRGLIRVGRELKGMVIMGGIAPADWPPTPEQVAVTAAEFGLPAEALIPHLHEVFDLDQAQRERVLALGQRIADSFAQIAQERGILIEKLKAIAYLANNNNPHNGHNPISHTTQSGGI